MGFCSPITTKWQRNTLFRCKMKVEMYFKDKKDSKNFVYSNILY